MRRKYSQLGDNPLFEIINSPETSIISPITDYEPPGAKLEVMFHADAVEFRIDKFKRKTEQAVRELDSEQTLPVLGTVRIEEDGGGVVSTPSEQRRADFFSRIIDTVDGLDIEVSRPDTLQAIATEATAVGKLIVGSYYNSEMTPSNKFLKDKAQKALDLGASFVKLAVTPRSSYSIDQIYDFTGEYAADLKLIVVRLGALGRPLDALLLRKGSHLGYATPKNGRLFEVDQIALHELHRLIGHESPTVG